MEEKSSEHMSEKMCKKLFGKLTILTVKIRKVQTENGIYDLDFIEQNKAVLGQAKMT